MKTSVTKATKTQEWVHKPRVASFTCKKVNGKREFHAVNDRAHKLARKCGKRSVVTVADLKQFKGYFKLRQYADGKLKAITL